MNSVIAFLLGVICGCIIYPISIWIGDEWDKRKTQQINQKIKENIKPSHLYNVGDIVYIDYVYQKELVTDTLFRKENLKCTVEEVLWSTGYNEEGEWRHACYKLHSYEIPEESTMYNQDSKYLIRYENEIRHFQLFWVDNNPIIED